MAQSSQKPPPWPTTVRQISNLTKPLPYPNSLIHHALIRDWLEGVCFRLYTETPVLLRKLCCVSHPGVQTHELHCLIFLCLEKIISASFHLCSVLTASEVPKVAYPSGSLQPPGPRAPRKEKGISRGGTANRHHLPTLLPTSSISPIPLTLKATSPGLSLFCPQGISGISDTYTFSPPSSFQDPSKGLRRGLQPPPAAPTAATWPWVGKSFPSAPAHLLSLGCEQRASCKESSSPGELRLKLNHRTSLCFPTSCKGWGRPF